MVARTPGRWELAWPGAADAIDRLVIAETWDAGWRATLDGRPLAVEAVDDLWLGVRPGAKPGRLVVSYLPQGLFWGLVSSAFGLAALLVGSRRSWLAVSGTRDGAADAVADPMSSAGARSRARASWLTDEGWPDARASSGAERAPSDTSPTRTPSRTAPSLRRREARDDTCVRAAPP